MFHKIVALSLLFVTSFTVAQNLEVVLSNTRLPVPVRQMPVLFDGEDSIYVMGGHNGSFQRDILKFSITTETLDKFGTIDPIIAMGSAVWAGNENILYFGGYSSSGQESRVLNYNPDGGREWTQVGDLPRACSYTSSVWDHGEYTYIFGGWNSSRSLNTITRYSSVTHTSVDVGVLTGPRLGTSAVWDETNGNAYIFGGYVSSNQKTLTDIVKFNPVEGTVLLNVTLPVETRYSCAIWTGKEAYIIGGAPETGSALNIVRFNPTTNEVLNVPVNNFPTELEQHSCAFVRKLNRIYIFGGYTGSGLRDQILYIDLGPIPTEPTSTPITTTTKRPDIPIDCSNHVDRTTFPDPYCCRSFYECENQEAIFRQCPSQQLLFNPVHGECDLAENVNCRAVFE